MDGISKYNEEYKSSKKRKILIAFDYMIAHMLSNKNNNPVATEIFIRWRKHFPCFDQKKFILLYQKLLY